MKNWLNNKALEASVLVVVGVSALGMFGYAAYKNTNYSAYTNYCSLYEPDYTDTAFPGVVISDATSYFGDGSTASAASTKSTLADLQNLFTIQSAEAQTSGGSQLSSSAQVPPTLQSQLNSLISNNVYFTNTIALLKNPASFFNNQTNVQNFLTTFKNELVAAYNNPYLPYYQNVQNAENAVPHVFTDAFSSFAYGKKVDYSSDATNLPVNKLNTKTFSFKLTPSWTGVTVLPSAINFSLTLTNNANANGGYTLSLTGKCSTSLISGGASNAMSNLNLSATFNSGLSGSIGMDEMKHVTAAATFTTHF